VFPDLPLEFIIFGTAVSLQAKSEANRAAWKNHVRETAREARGSDRWALESELAVTLYYFPEGKMQGDVDNIVKLVLDGLARCIFTDDRQIERIVVQKFEPDKIFAFADPSEMLLQALNAERARLYVKITDDIHGELR
jgi:crossover junction endodeoxyribonuclease RusA